MTQEHFEEKNVYFLNFRLMFVEAASEMKFPCKQGKVYLSSFIFKPSPTYFRESYEGSRENLLSFRSYAPKTTRRVEKGPPVLVGLTLDWKIFSHGRG